MLANLLEPTPLPSTVRGNRMPVGSPLYNECVEFLIDEAEMLDELRFDEWRALLAQDIWCGEIKNHLEAVDDPQVRHRGIVTSYRHATAGDVKVIGPVVQMSATPPAIDRPAPVVGQHSEEILAEYGISAEAVADFKAKGLIEQSDV